MGELRQRERPHLLWQPVDTLTGGLTVNADGSRLTLFDGSTYYTLNGSGLRVMDENFSTTVDTDGKVKATYTGQGDAATKQHVADLIEMTVPPSTGAAAPPSSRR